MIEEVLEQRLKTVMLEVLVVLHDNGIRHVSAGALMRLFGVPNTAAQEWDDTIFEIDDSVHDFDALINTTLSSKQLH